MSAVRFWGDDMRLFLIAFLISVPLPVWAEDYTCQSSGYCVNNLECFPASEPFSIQLDKSGAARFGWDNDVSFTATGQRMDGMTVFRSQTNTAAIQTLVLADNLQASFSVSVVVPELGLYTSIQALTCQRT